MKGIFLFILIVLYSVVGLLEASIFDSTGNRHGSIRSLKSRLLAKRFGDNGYQRHINTLALDSSALEKVKRTMRERLGNNLDDDSNERNIWRSHPLKPDFEGPDTTEAVGLNLEI